MCSPRANFSNSPKSSLALEGGTARRSNVSTGLLLLPTGLNIHASRLESIQRQPQNETGTVEVLALRACCDGQKLGHFANRYFRNVFAVFGNSADVQRTREPSFDCLPHQQGVF